MENLVLQNKKEIINQKETFNSSQINHNIFLTKMEDTANSEKQFLCEKCNKLFSTFGNLKIHINSIHYNNRPFKCTFPNCTKKYVCETKLIIHERTHTGFKPFICQICQKSFNEKGNLKEHIKTHSEIRPCKCHLCGKGFKCTGTLKEHIKYFHYKIKRFCCRFCNKAFGKMCMLKTHLIVHTKEKKYKCEFESCGKCFTEKRNMLKHYARHFKNTNEKINNESLQKSHGPKKNDEDFEAKIRNALNQLDNKNIEEVNLEEKTEKGKKMDIINQIEKTEVENKMDVINPTEKTEEENKMDVINPTEKTDVENKMAILNPIDKKEIENKMDIINPIEKTEIEKKIDILNPTEKTEIENKMNIDLNKTKENLPPYPCGENKNNYINFLNSVNNSCVKNLFNFTNFFPLIFNLWSNNNNLIGITEKNDKNNLKGKNINNDNYYDISNIYNNNINTRNNTWCINYNCFIGSNFDNLNTLRFNEENNFNEKK